MFSDPQHADPQHGESGSKNGQSDSLETFVSFRDLTPKLARALDVSIEELVGSENRKVVGKRGPAPKIQQQLERIHALPKP